MALGRKFRSPIGSV